MSALQPYHSYAFWAAGLETPAMLAQRFDRLVDCLEAIDPRFSDWTWLGANRTPIPFASVRPALANEIENAVVKGDFGEPLPVYGYHACVLANMETPCSVSAAISGGSPLITDIGYANTGDIHTPWRSVPDPTIVAYPIWKAALLALSECFDVAFCNAYPSDLREHWGEGQKFRLGWMVYVAPRFAALVTPPATTIVEYRPNGGLFMAATDETFITANPQHLAAAREIERAIAPLNRLPWPLEPEL